MAFFLTAPVDPGTGEPPGSTASWTDGSGLFGAYTILAAGIDNIAPGDTAKVTSTGVVLGDDTILFVSFRQAAPDATATTISAVNAGANPDDMTVTANAAATAGTFYCWMVLGVVP